MFRFEDPIYLYLLLLIPVLVLIRWWMVMIQRKRLRRFRRPGTGAPVNARCVALPSVGEVLPVAGSLSIAYCDACPSTDGHTYQSRRSELVLRPS